jgi:polyisoprenoid-binding protein YceI
MIVAIPTPTIIERGTIMSNPHLIALGLAAALISSTAQAQAIANPDPRVVQAGNYRLESKHARILFATSHIGFSTWYGDLPNATGNLSLDPANLAAASLDVSVPVAGISTTNAILDGELRSPAWLDANQFPAITFKSSKVIVTSPRTAQVTGDLTFHGVTRPVVLEASFRASGVNPLTKAYTIGFEVRGRIKRSDFGVKTYVPMIGDDVDLTISAPFEKK